MKWYKHDTDASADAKIKKLLLRHGATGYAVYFHCLELIAAEVSDTNITFELEHDAEIIADNLKIRGTADESGIDQVNRIMRTIIDLGLFEDRDGRVTCMKMLKRLDTSMTSSPKMRKLITAAKESHDAVMIESSPSHDDVMMQSCKTRLDKTRREEYILGKSGGLEWEEAETLVDNFSEDVKPESSNGNKGKAKRTDDRVKLIIAYLNEKAGTRFLPTAKSTQRHINNRLAEGHEVDDFKKAIVWCVSEWQDNPEMNLYIRPDTIFGTKMPGYVENYARKKRQLEEEV